TDRDTATVGGYVLNASRRHCGRHHTPQRVLLCRGRCSPPLGVTVVGTGLVTASGAVVAECSTPLGVTVVGTRPGGRGRSRPGCGPGSAQRLSASLWSAP